jgi:hypothetical protein
VNQVNPGANTNAEVRYSLHDGGLTVINGMTADGINVTPPTRDRPYTTVTVTLVTFGQVVLEAGQPA